MASPSQPQGDYAELSQLALRITKHLQQHPYDTQAQADLKYVTSQIPRDAPPMPEAYPGRKIAAGLVQAGLDIPRGIISSILHPIQTAGQITGIGNAVAADKALHDPEASLAEKADAVLRATPFNMGYAAERGLLNATGAKSDEPASLTDQAHAAGNVASLALLGVNPKASLRLLGRGAKGALGPILDRLPTMKRYTPQESPQAAIQREMIASAPSEVPARPASVAAVRAHEAGKISGAEMSRRIGLALGQQPQSLLQPRLTPILGYPRGFLGPEGISPPAKASYAPSIAEIQGRPGHPTWQGEGSPTTSAQVRGGEPLLPSANPEVAATLQRTPFAQLQAALRKPETPQVIKNLILMEIQRRGIVGPGLLASR